MVVQCTNGAAYIWQLENGNLEGTASGQIAKNIVAAALPMDQRSHLQAIGGVSILTARLDTDGNMVCVCVFVFVCVCVCVHACVRARVYACVCVFSFSHVRKLCFGLWSRCCLFKSIWRSLCLASRA